MASGFINDGLMDYLGLTQVIYGQRCVVGKAFGLVDAGRLRALGDAGRSNLIINPPADIFRPGLAAI